MEVIHVREIKALKLKSEEYEYVGRRAAEFRGSPLGNPFRIGTYTREEAIQKYRQWLKEEILKEGVVYQELVRLVKRYRENKDIKLACWCKPQACHAEVIMRAILWLNETMPNEEI